jgi:amino acid permease
MSGRAEPLLPAVDGAGPSRWNILWASLNLLATTVGAGMLSLPISFAYCGSALPALMLLGFFGMLSAASFRFIFGAAMRMEQAPSYLALGERCFGSRGSAAVLVSLMALLASAFVQVSIIVIDVAEMLLLRVFEPFEQLPGRVLTTVLVLALVVPLCLPRDLRKLTFASTLSVACSLFTCGSIVTLSLMGEPPELPPDVDGRPRDSASQASTAALWPLAMPIFSLAFCSQFQILDIAYGLHPRQRRYVPAIIHVTMAIAAGIYALVGFVCFGLLGERALHYPNVLTAFGDVPLVAFGSAAIACVNFLKLPLVFLPLRALLLEQCGFKTPPTGASHVLLTVAMVAVLGVATVLAGNLAFAFQLGGSTAGVSVCFILPGILHVGSLRHERRAGRAMEAPSDPSARGGASLGRRCVDAASALIPQTCDEVAGVAMAVAGLGSGAICLWALTIE